MFLAAQIPLFIPGYKREGPSKEAALSFVDLGRALTKQAATLLEKNDLTADEVAWSLGANVLAVRPRVSKLVELGYVRDSGKRRKNESGKNATVWTWAR